MIFEGGTLVAQLLGLHPHLFRLAVNICGRIRVYTGLTTKLSKKMDEIREKVHLIAFRYLVAKSPTLHLKGFLH